MKTRIEESANAWVTADEEREFGNGPYPQQHCHFAFIAGAKFMQDEVEKLKSQNEIMREALEVYRLMGVGNTIADKALKKVGEV